MEATIGFKPGVWQKEINVSDFIKNNYTEYTGDETFLAGPTEATDQLWAQLSEMFKVEREKGIHNAENKKPSQIDAYGAGYINKDLEKVQSDIDKLLVLKERLLKAKSGLNQ